MQQVHAAQPTHLGPTFLFAMRRPREAVLTASALYTII